MESGAEIFQEPETVTKPRHRHDSTVLCRFVSGEFEKVDIDFRHTNYIAFSHVWGDPSLYHPTTISNIPEPIIATPSKARCLDQNLQRLVGDSYFWLDVLSIDQSPETVEERIQATAIMPDIYKHAQKTIVIRDGSGFQSCCVDAIGQLRTWADYHNGIKQWNTHWRTDHRGQRLYEGILERLWPLQESVFSNHVQFISCEESLARTTFSWGDIYSRTQFISANTDRLWTMSRAWASYGTTGEVSGDEQLAFMNALLHNGEISRDRTSRIPFSSAIGREFLIQSNSTRRTTKARDLILTTMSQYSWYTAPTPRDIRNMSFGQLFRDCFDQARRAHRATLPRITGGMVGDDGLVLETSNIPEPEYLGDLVKLFGLATDAAPNNEKDCASGLEYGKVGVRTIESISMVMTFDIIDRSLDFSPDAWKFALRGELSMSPYGVWPDEKLFLETVSKEVCQEQAMKFLNLMLIGHFGGGGAKLDADSFKRDLINANASNYSKFFIRIAALISCGIGISALSWSENVWTPVLVSIGELELLGLVSSAEMVSGEENVFHLATPLDSSTRVTYRYFVLTRRGRGLKARHRCVGLVPEFYNESEDREVFLRRWAELGFEEKCFGRVVNLF